jgi:WD40 repeat protein
MLGHHDVVWGLSFSRDGSRLASWAGDGTRLWSVNHRTELGPLPTAEEKALALTITRDARVVARVGKDQHITLWDLISGQPFGLPLSEQRSEPIYAMRFSWDGKMLAIAYERSIQIWNLSTGRLIGQPLDPLSSVFNLAFSPDGKTLASGGVRGDRLFLWDLASGLALKPALLGHEGSISCLEFSPDGRTLASGGDDGRVFLWDVTTRRRFGPPLEGHEGPVLSLDFSPDGTILASGGNDKTVFLWDVSLEAWRDRACRIAGRNLSHIEWQQFLNREPYRKSCPTLPEPEQGKAFDRVWMYGCCAQ